MRNIDGKELTCNHKRNIPMVTFLGELKLDNPRSDFPTLERDVIESESGIRNLTKEEYLLEQIALGVQMIAESMRCNNESSIYEKEVDTDGFIKSCFIRKKESERNEEQ